MEVLTKEKILAAQDLQVKEVNVPEWGGAILVRGLTGTERDKFESSVLRGQGRNMSVNMENLRSKLVAMSVVDQEGKRLFSDQDALELGKKSAVVLNRIFGIAQALSGLTDDEVSELAEGLGKAPGENSTSG